MIDRNKIGLVITTFNSENYFETLFNSLPDDRYGPLVVVNGGEPYKKIYKRMHGEVHWIQHEQNFGPARSRNDGLKKLYDLGCEWLFVFEDDMIVKSEDIFDQYINASKITGLEYMHFVSYAWGVGQPGNRTPKLQVQYSPELTINCFGNMCNEFTIRTRKLYELVGPYDENMTNGFDCEWVKRASETPFVSPMWNFVDLSNSDNLIMNNPQAVSRLDGDGKRIQRLGPDYEYFRKKHGHHIKDIPQLSRQQVIDKLQRLKGSIK